MGIFSKKKTKVDKKELKDVSSNKITIKVYKNFGSNVPFLVATYQAEEMRDEFNNLVSINSTYFHNEDVDYAIDDVYERMNVVLELKNKSREKRVELLENAIKKKERLVKLLDKFVELNALYNYADEALKLRDYQILLNFLKNHDSDNERIL